MLTLILVYENSAKSGIFNIMVIINFSQDTSLELLPETALEVGKQQ
ncbi:MAG: hypothetical protein AMDU5_GPLC00005G0082 [Thermoplasmatales archaeon Gpl]|nr:MAG: hypothetical protein AMDU5_GPLC00012G0001 [Thermoplasmatales archaeon Gpl]EQB69009.1 MAG: hypothetical protein AMDU5_GPLC00005G0082 [Thermoplasmatales archaeon Gpl]